VHYLALRRFTMRARITPQHAAYLSAAIFCAARSLPSGACHLPSGGERASSSAGTCWRAFNATRLHIICSAIHLLFSHHTLEHARVAGLPSCADHHRFVSV